VTKQIVSAASGYWLKDRTGAYRRIVAWLIDGGYVATPITADDEYEITYDPHGEFLS
jgi:hypothetical protein